MNGELAPIVTTAGSTKNHTELVDSMYATASLPLAFLNTNVKAPFIIDRIEASIVAVPFAEALDITFMTGDLCRCIGWYMLSPESLRKANASAKQRS